MNPLVFNICLLLGWLLVLAGLTLWSVPVGLAAAGLLLMAVTLYLARWVGVRAARPMEGNPHVSD